MVLDALKKRLHDDANSKGGKWIRELPNALWVYVLSPPSQRGNLHTSWSTAPKQSSLLMSYGIHQQWSTTTKASLKTADELTSTDSKKLAQSARYLEGIRRYHDRNIKERFFNVGDLVLHRIQNTEGLHKLSPPGKVPSQWQR
jgi:hypothetical protein